MQSKASTVEEYLAGLPEERRAALLAIRAVILKNLPKGYEEGMQYGMIGYFVPHSVFPAGYHCDPKQPLPFAGLASQKNHMSLYFMCVYGDPKLREWFVSEWKKTGLKLDMGKSCIRFKSLDGVPLKLIGQVVKRVPVKKFVEFYEGVLSQVGKKRAPAGKAKSPAKKKAKAKKTTAKSKPKAKAQRKK